MNKNSIGVIIVLIIVIVGGWFLLSGTPAQAPSTTTGTTGTTGTTQNPVTTTTTTSTTTTSTTAPGVIITYTNQGFSPKSVTIPLGTSVTFVDQASSTMWVGSAPHPTHQGYDGTTESKHCAAGYNGPAPFDQCSASTAFSFTFTKVGTWPYHNHNSAKDFGSIVVTAPATPN